MLSVVVATTAPLFTLEEAKAHLHVEAPEHDALITTYSNAAVARVLQYCNLALVPDGEVPEAAFKAAALMTLEALFADRRGESPLAPAAIDLIEPYRQLRV